MDQCLGQNQLVPFLPSAHNGIGFHVGVDGKMDAA